MEVGSEIGAYRIVQQIGAGGMGEVWLAEHAALGRLAAIKVLRPELSSRGDMVARFFNEARAAATIRDPGIVQIFDFGQHADGSAYIVMEALDGEPLDRRLARMGALPIADAVRLMRQVASTLGAAHARGIVHRDLKPENVFVVRDPEVPGGERPKVLDFGIAKLSGDTGVKTQTAAMMGTPTYMSPEQCRGAGLVDARSDVYALGCMLFRLVCGRPPFDSEGAGEIIAMHLREPAPLASALAPHVPAALDALIARCLAKDPTARFDSGAALAAELATLSPAGATATMPAIVTSAMPAERARPVPTTLSSAALEVARPTGRARWLIGGVAVVALGAAATFAMVAREDAQDDEPSPRERTQPAAAPTVDAPVATAPVDAGAPDAPDLLADTNQRISVVLATFVTWSAGHAGAPCPGARELGVSLDDAWGHGMRITCSDQPVDQMIGVVSAGPDSTFGTTDDVVSWRLGSAITAPIHGPRWARPKTPAAPPTVHPTPKIDCFEQRC